MVLVKSPEWKVEKGGTLCASITASRPRKCMQLVAYCVPFGGGYWHGLDGDKTVKCGYVP